MSHSKPHAFNNKSSKQARSSPVDSKSQLPINKASKQAASSESSKPVEDLHRRTLLENRSVARISHLLAPQGCPHRLNAFPVEDMTPPTWHSDSMARTGDLVIADIACILLIRRLRGLRAKLIFSDQRVRQLSRNEPVCRGPVSVEYSPSNHLPVFGGFLHCGFRNDQRAVK